MSRNNSFSPGAVNATLAVTSVTGAVTLSGGGAQVRISNVGTVEAFTAFAATVAGGGTKSSNDDGGLSIAPSTTVIYTLPPNATTLAAITASGGGNTTLRINRGDGA